MKPFDYARRMPDEFDKDTPLKDIMHLFKERDIGSVIILEESGRIMGAIDDLNNTGGCDGGTRLEQP
jgi:predicted transcriptional regulator